MKINYNDKIKTINDDRDTLINLIKENNNTQSNKLTAGLEGLSTVLDFDNQNLKEYNSIKKAKKLINDLTEKILQCTNIEDIKKTRSQINYYINKIKKELKNRNIDQDTMDKMFEGVSSFRKSIAAYIRVLKREVTINEISTLYQNLDELSPDDRDKLKKLVNNEMKYNKRNINSFLTVDEPKKPESLETLNYEENPVLDYQFAEENNIGESANDGDIISEVDYELIPDSDENKEEQNISILSDIDVNESIQNLKSALIKYGYVSETFPDKQENLRSQVDVFKDRYLIEDLNSYNGKLLSDFVSFIHNIPIQFYNKKRIQLMLKHYKNLYHAQAFKYYIMYCLKSSSVKTAFEMIFKNSQLARREAECLYNHDRCVEWINDYYLNRESLYQEHNTKRTLSRSM